MHGDWSQDTPEPMAIGTIDVNPSTSTEKTFQWQRKLFWGLKNCVIWVNSVFMLSLRCAEIIHSRWFLLFSCLRQLYNSCSFYCRVYHLGCCAFIDLSLLGLKCLQPFTSDLLCCFCHYRLNASAGLPVSLTLIVGPFSLLQSSENRQNLLQPAL